VSFSRLTRSVVASLLGVDGNALFIPTLVLLLGGYPAPRERQAAA
jgi:hypothetical protein